MFSIRLSEPDPVENEPLERVEHPVPEPGPGELLLKISACGVCHPDMNTVLGEVHAAHRRRDGVSQAWGGDADQGVDDDLSTVGSESCPG